MLIIVAHGSRDPRWRASVESLTESLQGELGREALRLAYMDCAPPTLDDVVAEAVDSGVRHIRVLPLFLADEGHVDRDVRPAVAAASAAHPSADIRLLPAMGQHRFFREMLAKITTEESKLDE